MNDRPRASAESLRGRGDRRLGVGMYCFRSGHNRFVCLRHRGPPQRVGGPGAERLGVCSPADSADAAARVSGGLSAGE